MSRAMKLSIPTRDNEANVAVALIKSGRPWMGYSLVIVCRALWCLTLLAGAVLGAIYGFQ
jgi:hypothetical protein